MSRIVIAGGGTGGHLYPGLAVAEALAARGIAVTFVGTAGGIEARVVPGAGYPLQLLPGRQLRGGGVGRFVLGLGAAAGGAVRALRVLDVVGPSLVIGVGGYASVAVVLAAVIRRIPTVLLEQNVVPGAANRWLARFARRICVGFAESMTYFPAGRAIHTGNPVRAGLLRARTPGSRPGILVFGGSAGAHRLNQATLEALALLGREPGDLEVTHQTGTADFADVRSAYERLGLRVRVEPFISDMGAAYAAADVVVARAGATTCAELTAIGLPSILVPYPYAADDHQRRNAEVLAESGAAEMILEAELSGTRLAASLRALLDDGERRSAMASRARALGRPDAAVRVAETCLRERKCTSGRAAT